MTLRYQVDPGEPLTFMDVKVGKQVKPKLLLLLSSCIPAHFRTPFVQLLLCYGRGMLHKLVHATLMWPTSGVRLAASP